GRTVSAWVRQTLRTAMTPRSPTRSSATHRKLERAVEDLKAIPRACTLGEASAMLDLSPRAITGKLRAGQLAGYRRHRSFYDPGRGKYLRRTWWMIPWSALHDYMQERARYELEHQLRLYKPSRSGPRLQPK